MKTRLYTLVTGLLMAACITSYGQEIIGTYEHNLDRTYSYNDLVTCSDGSVLSGIYCYNLENGQCTGMHVCKVSGEGHTCEMASMMDHLAPITRGAIKDSYLLAAQIRTSDDTYATSLIKFDKDHNAIAFTNLETPTRMGGNPICTEVIDENTIYHTYNLYPNSYYLPVVGLARLNRDMDVVWNIEFPMIPNSMSYGTTLKVLANGDIAVSVVSGNYSPYCKLYIYIIRDNDPTAIPETTAPEKPFDIYPNPVNDRLSLRFDDGATPESVELYSLAGSLVAKHCKSLETIDLSAMSTGVYLLCVTFEDGEKRFEKVVKQ